MSLILLLSLMISCGSNSQIYISSTPTSVATQTPTGIPGTVTPIMTFTATPVPATQTSNPSATAIPIATSTATPVPAPVINSIEDNNGDDKDPENGNSDVSFSVFGSHLSGTGVKVTFTDVDSGTIFTGTVNSFTDGELKGTITIPGGKYVIEVTVGGKNSNDVVYFYKGTGTYGKS